MGAHRGNRRLRGGPAVAGALAIVVTALLVPLSASAAPGATGNAAAIRLYRVAAATTNALPAYVISQHGYVRISDSIGKRRRTAWAWGQDQFQKGEVPTHEHLVLVQRAGKVLWIEDTLRPDVTCDSGGTCPAMLPLQFLITRSAAYVGIVSSGSTAACFSKEPLNDVPYAAGDAWWWAIGEFSAAVKDGAFTSITAKYPNSGQQEAETDWIDNASKLFARSTFRVTAAHHHRAFRFAANYTKLQRRPRQPHVTICS